MKKLLVEAAGAVIWGAFFSISPILEVLVLGAIVWIPLFAWREWVRSKESSLFPGIALRLGVIAAVVSVAMMLPLKYEDRHRVDPPSGAKVVLSDLSGQIHVPRSHPPTVAATVIHLPSTQPTLREVLRAVETATGLSVRAARCGNCATLVWGAHLISFTLE